MIPSPPWLAPFQTGMDALRDRSFNAAFTSFDEAVNIGGSQLAVFASRAEVLDRLRVLEGAVVNHGTSESRRFSSSDDDPSHLFQTLSNLPEYLQTAIIAPPTQQSTSLEGPLLQAQALVSSLLQTRSFIDFLPAELLTSIGRYVVFEERNYRCSDPAFKLVAVSRRWRSIFLQDPLLWGFLALDGGGTVGDLRKAEIFMEKGPLRGVRIFSSWGVDDPNLVAGLYRLLLGRRSSLEELVASVRYHSDWDVLWSLVNHPSPPSNPPKLHMSLDFSMSRHLFPLHLTETSLPSLTSLALSNIVRHDPSSVLFLFERLPNLASFSITDCHNLVLLLPTVDGTDKLELPLLASLVVAGSGSDVLPLQPFLLIAPLLTSLSIKRADPFVEALLYPSSLPPPNYPSLQVLHVEQEVDTIYGPTLLKHLRRLPTLHSLRLRWFGELTNLILPALTIRAEEGGSEDVLLPNLASLDLAHSGPVSDEETKAMIRSRKEEGRKEGGRCCVVREFIVGEEEVTEEMAKWLKENVEHFSEHEW